MGMAKRWKCGLAAAGLLLWAALAAVFGRYDLQISQAVYAPDTWWARGLEFAGWLVTPIILTWCLHFLLYRHGRATSQRWHWLGHVLFFTAISGIILVLSGASEAAHAGDLCGLMRAGAAETVYLVGLVVILANRRSLTQERLEKIGRVAWLTILGCAAVFVVVSVLKNCAGRVRYRELQALSQYTPWYQWNPFSGNYSFPSGHTANASGVFCLALLAPLVKAGWKRAALTAAPFAFLAVMGASRVIVGAHFASDVLFGMGISVTVFFAVAFLAGRRGKKKRKLGEDS